MDIRHLEIEDLEDAMVNRSRTGIAVHHPCVEHPAFAVAGMSARISRPGLSSPLLAAIGVFTVFGMFFLFGG